jgi:hypothetical protein
MTEGNGNLVMPVGPMGGYGNGGGFGFGGDGGAWWLLILLIALGGGWGNGFGFGGGAAAPMMVNNDVQRGFDQSALVSGINGVQNAVVSGFGDVQTALCGGFAGVNSNISNGFAQTEIAANARQMADMQQMFGVQSALQNFCCENRANIADLKYTVATENCADRAALSDGIRDVLTACNANTQRILDTMCQDKIDAKNEKILELQNQLNMANFAASQTAQNSYLRNALTEQTQYIMSVYPPTVPARVTVAA